MKPTISVVMPVYNQERFVAHAVASVLAQTFTDFELIIVDDGSTDRTPEILSTFRDARIKIIRQANTGFTAALTVGYHAARGEWIARMDSDDVSHPTRLAKQFKFLSEHPDCAFVGTAYGYATPNNRFLDEVCQFDWRFVEAVHITLGDRIFGDPTVMFHRKTAASVGYYDDEFENENPLWYRLLRIGKGAVLGETLYYNRWIMGSVSKSRFVHWANVHVAVRNKYDPENAAKLKVGSAFCEQTGYTRKLKQGLVVYLLAGDRIAALRLAWSGWKSLPFSVVRNKLLLYSILGIEGVRTTQMKKKANRLVRSFPPLFPGDDSTADGFIHR